MQRGDGAARYELAVRRGVAEHAASSPAAMAAVLAAGAPMQRVMPQPQPQGGGGRGRGRGRGR